MVLRLFFVGPEAAAVAATPKSQEALALASDGASLLGVRWSRHRGTLGEFLDGGGTAASGPAEEGGGGGGGKDVAPQLVWLSNPGLGHPLLTAAWAPCLSTCLRRAIDVHGSTVQTAAATTRGGSSGGGVGRCPVLVTSHSEADQARDVAAVAALVGSPGQSGWVVAPEGPARFRSRRAVADPIEGGWVAANWGAMVVG
jgi:hypothetical protein